MATGKRDGTWKGSFIMDMLLDFEGFSPILTISVRTRAYTTRMPSLRSLILHRLVRPLPCLFPSGFP